MRSVAQLASVFSRTACGAFRNVYDYLLGAGSMNLSECAAETLSGEDVNFIPFSALKSQIL